MSPIDELIASIDTDRALSNVVQRHHRATVRRRWQGRLAAVACVAALVGVVWVTSRSVEEQSLDVSGDPRPGTTANLEATTGTPAPVGTSPTAPSSDSTITPSSVTTVSGDGLSVTLAIDDDVVAIGDPVTVSITLTNKGTSTIAGSWNATIGCNQSIGFAIRMLDADGNTLSIGNLDHGDNAWFAPREDLAATVRRFGTGSGLSTQQSPGPEGTGGPRRGDITVPEVLSEPLSLRKPCTYPPQIDQLQPGQTVTHSATWRAWIGAGALPEPGTLLIETILSAYDCTGCDLPPRPRPGCPTCSTFGVGGASLPIRIDLATRIDPPTADQLALAVDRADVQQILDTIGPRTDAGAQPRYGGWLLQIDQRWLQRIQGSTGAADIWFDTSGAVTDVQTKALTDIVTPP